MNAKQFLEAFREAFFEGPIRRLKPTDRPTNQPLWTLKMASILHDTGRKAGLEVSCKEYKLQPSDFYWPATGDSRNSLGEKFGSSEENRIDFTYRLKGKKVVVIEHENLWNRNKAWEDFWKLNKHADVPLRMPFVTPLTEETTLNTNGTRRPPIGLGRILLRITKLKR